MENLKTKVATYGIAAAVLLGVGSSYSLAAEKENVKPIQSVQKSEQVNEISNQEKKVYVKAEGILKGTGSAMLNNAKLFELLQMDAAELQKELDTGKTVIEVAASKNVSEKEVNAVILQAEVEKQLRAVENKEPGITAPPKDELAKQISKKVQQVTAPSVQKSEQVNEISNQEKKVYVKAEGILKGTGSAMLNNAKLFELLQMDAAELQEELDTGKTVIEVAASKNVSEKEVNAVILQAEVEKQLRAVENKEPGITAPPKDELAEQISKKVQQVTANTGK